MKKIRLRSRDWFDDPSNPTMTALYLERYMNYGLTLSELQGNKPIVGIAQTGSDLAPCNRVHIGLAKRVRDGIIAKGGIPLEFPTHPIQETGKRPTAALDRNLTYLSLSEILYGYPLDGVVLLTGCDKTTPACLMAASSVNIPAICLSSGPMLNGWDNSKQGTPTRVGSGSIIWQSRLDLVAGKIDEKEFMSRAASSAPSDGHCNTMGTALSMNSLVEALGMCLKDNAAIPASYRQRPQMAYDTGKKIVDLVLTEIRPSDILTKAAFINAIVVCSAIGGSTNCPIHINAIARHIGIDIDINDWQKYGFDIPLLVNLQPAGEYLGEDFFLAGGVGAVIYELCKAGKIDKKATTILGNSLYQQYENAKTSNPDVIRPFNKPLKKQAGFMVLSSNFFDSAIMKTSVISDDFKSKHFKNNILSGKVVIFESSKDYHDRIDDENLDIDKNTILVIRNAGPIGWPGSAEVVNMQPPKRLIDKGIDMLPCLGDGRQSGTSASPSILNVSPEAAVGGGIALLKDGDKIKIDLNQKSVILMIDNHQIKKRQFAYNKNKKRITSDTPWQEIYRNHVGQLESGACLETATKYQNIYKKKPKHNH